MQTSMLAMHAANQALFDAGSIYRTAVEPVAAGLAHLVVREGYKRVTIVNLTGQAMDSIAMSLSLGRLLAMRGLNTVLVDAGIGGAGVQNLATDLSPRGIYDLVSGTAGFSDVIRKDRPTALQVIAPGSAAPTASGLDAGQVEGLEQAIKALEQVYQACLVHLGEGNNGNVELAASSQVVLVLAGQARLAEAREICAALKSGRVRQAEVICVEATANRAASGGFHNIAATL